MDSSEDNYLDNFFYPKTIAVIGASRNPKKIGHKIFLNLQNNNKKSIYPINPNATKIDRFRSYPSVLSVKDSIDLGIIVIPAEFVEESILQCYQKGIKNIIVISAGFSEIGENGRILEEKISKFAIRNHIKILGPNCLGIISPANNLNASFGQIIDSGKATFISQSGALGTAILDWAKERNFGFANFISLGNKAVLSENDFLRYFSKKKVPIIALYLESLTDGREFLRITRELSHKIPIIVLKGGQEKETKVAVTSHTGAMTGSFEAFRAALQQSNCIESENLEEFFSLLEIISSLKTIKGRRIILLTNGGGPGILTLDTLIQTKNKLAQLSKKSKILLKSLLPKEVSIVNPIDILGDATPQRYENVLKILLADSEIDIVYILLTPQEVTNVKAIANSIVKVSLKSSKVIMASFIGGQKVNEGKTILRKGNILHFPFPQQGLKALSKIFNYLERKRQKFEPLPKSSKQKKNIGIAKALTENRHKLYEEEAFNLLNHYHLIYPKTIKIKDLQFLDNQLKKMKFPLALKLDSQKVMHRTKENAIFINLETIREAKVAYSKLRRMTGNIYCQEMVKPGIEIIIGAKKDPDFGHLIMFGSGGIYTEYLFDVSFGVIPLTEQDIKDMILRTKIGKRLNRYIEKLTRIIKQISRLLEENPAISELDINPLIINNNGHYIVDVKVRLS